MDELPFTYSFSGKSNVPGDVAVFIARLMPVVQRLYPSIAWNYHKSTVLEAIHRDIGGNRNGLYIPDQEGVHVFVCRNVNEPSGPWFDGYDQSEFRFGNFNPPGIDHVVRLSIECEIRDLTAGTFADKRCEIELASDNKFIFEYLQFQIERILKRFVPKGEGQ